MYADINNSNYPEIVSSYFNKAVQSANNIFVDGVEVSASTFLANQFNFDNREIHVSNRVVIPPEIVAGGLDELIAYPRSKNALMVRVGSSDPVDIDPKDWRWQDHVKTTISHDSERGTIVYHTIAFPKAVYGPYYEGLINGFLWPLNHDFLDIAKQPYLSFNAAGREIYDRGRFEREVAATKCVNTETVDFIVNEINPQQRDSIQIHDPHFLEAGLYLREKHVDCPIAFFLHTPATSEVSYRNLPEHKQRYYETALHKLYAYDLVGVQHARDIQNIWALAGDDRPPNDPALYETYEMTRKDRHHIRDCRLHTTKIGVLPVVGHNSLYAAQAAANENLLKAENFLCQNNYQMPNWFNWGREDYTKNGVNRERAIDFAIEHFEVPADHIVSLHQAAMGRQGVLAFREEHERVVAANREVMEKHGPAGLQANLYSSRIERPTALALARLTGETGSGVGMIVPLIDGFNLTATEWIFAQNPEKPGVLVLGKNAGAAPIIDKGALQVNAASPYEIAGAAAWAMRMPESQKLFMHRTAINRISRYTNAGWQSALIDGARKSWEEMRARSGIRIYPSARFDNLKM